MKEKETDQLHLLYSSKMEQLKLQISLLISQKKGFIAKSDAEVTELKNKIAIYETQVKNKEKTLQQEREKLARERDLNRRLTSENTELQTEICQYRTRSNSIKQNLEADVSVKNATIERMNSELEAKTKALEEMEAVVSGLSEQLTRVRENLSLKQPVSS